MFKPLKHIILVSMILFACGASIRSQTESLKCAYCAKEIQGEYIRYNGKNYHPACYEKIAPRCALCGALLQSEYIEVEGKLYHESCYLENVAPRCDICGQPIAGEYIVDFWGNKYHPVHQEQLPRCIYCNRLISDNTTNGGVEYADGRRVCRLCYNSAVLSDEQVESIAFSVRACLKKYAIEVDMASIPVRLIDQPTLMKLYGEDNPHSHGFCQYQEKSINGKVISRSNTIYILHGLPQRIFEGVLAHEMMHAWVNLNSVRRSDLWLNEGAANYASYLIHSQYSDKWSEYLINNLRQNPDKIYGGGFRKVEKIVQINGIDYLLSLLRQSN